LMRELAEKSIEENLTHDCQPIAAQAEPLS
jgi:hypothetical protein